MGKMILYTATESNFHFNIHLWLSAPYYWFDLPLFPFMLCCATCSAMVSFQEHWLIASTGLWPLACSSKRLPWHQCSIDHLLPFQIYSHWGELEIMFLRFTSSHPWVCWVSSYSHLIRRYVIDLQSQDFCSVSCFSKRFVWKEISNKHIFKMPLFRWFQEFLGAIISYQVNFFTETVFASQVWVKCWLT